MKKTILLLTPLFMAVFSQAQITKGSLLLGGNLAFQSSTSKSNNSTTESKYSRYTIGPSLGVAIRTNTIFGGGLTFGNGKQTNGDFRRNEDSYGAQLFFRKYQQLIRNLYLFGELSSYYSHDKETDIRNGMTERILKQNSAGLSLYPGISYALNKKFHVELGINRLANLRYFKNEISYPNSTVNGGHSSGVDFSTELSGFSAFTVGLRFLISN